MKLLVNEVFPNSSIKKIIDHGKKIITTIMTICVIFLPMQTKISILKRRLL